MMGNTICALADGTAMPMLGFIRCYTQEFYESAEKGMARGSLDDSARLFFAQEAT
jgi:hypothetical protein